MPLARIGQTKGVHISEVRLDVRGTSQSDSPGVIASARSCPAAKSRSSRRVLSYWSRPFLG